MASCFAVSVVSFVLGATAAMAEVDALRELLPLEDPCSAQQLTCEDGFVVKIILKVLGSCVGGVNRGCFMAGMFTDHLVDIWSSAFRHRHLRRRRGRQGPFPLSLQSSIVLVASPCCKHLRFLPFIGNTI